MQLKAKLEIGNCYRLMGSMIKEDAVGGKKKEE